MVWPGHCTGYSSCRNRTDSDPGPEAYGLPAPLDGRAHAVAITSTSSHGVLFISVQ